MAAEIEFAAVPIRLTVNGVQHEAVVEPRTLLVYFLREHLGLTGAHVGCDTSQCGACTIQLNGQAVKSCTILAAQANGAKITTVEGLAREGVLHPVQEGFREKHGLQCGYCTPGMIMTAVSLLRRTRIRRKKKSATDWKVTCAAVRATSISSNRSGGPPKKW